MKLLDKRSLLADGIHEFQFSPKSNVIAYWAPEHGNAPAHVDLIELPSREKLRQKNLFNVTKCSMVWQNDGEYLGVKVTRHTKSKKTLYNNLELFRLNEPGVPVEMLEIKDAVMAFAWEPSGSRFAMIHAENPTSTKVDVSFYDMMKKVSAVDFCLFLLLSFIYCRRWRLTRPRSIRTTSLLPLERSKPTPKGRPRATKTR